MAPASVSLLTASRRGCVHAAVRESSKWKSQDVEIDGLNSFGVHQVVPLPFLGLYMIAGANRVHLVRLKDGYVVHTFETDKMSPRSVKIAFSSSGSQGFTSLTLCYTAADTGDCVVRKYTPAHDDGMICNDESAASTRRDWCDWASAKEATRFVENPGSWDVLSDGSIVGVRQKSRRLSDTGYEGRRKTDGLRHRSPRKGVGRDVFGRWEVWTVGQNGRIKTDESRPLFQDDEQSGHLLVSELGRMVRIGQRSVVFSFGNMVKLVTVGGQERFDQAGDRNREYLNVGSRRRKGGGVHFRPRAWS